LAQFEILARTFLSEAKDYWEKAGNVEKKFEALRQSSEIVLNVARSLARQELLEKLDSALNKADRFLDELDELESYGRIVLTRGKELLTRFPMEALLAKIDEPVRTLIRLEHSRQRMKLHGEALKRSLLSFKEDVLLGRFP